MKTLDITCQQCGQVFQVEVDEEGVKFIGEERLKQMGRCDRCVDLLRSKQRSEYFANQRPEKPNQPF